MKKRFLFIFVAMMSVLFADSEMGCTISELLQAPKSILVEQTKASNRTKEKHEKKYKKSPIEVMKIAITENLMTVKVLHEKEEVFISRESVTPQLICPPFCIEPMNIKKVVTVAELEVLTFIEKLKEKKARLLIDVRENHFYTEGTIPGAINLPFSMLQDGSKYQEEILKLLGAKLKKEKVQSKNSNLQWSFNNAQTLLIFGESATSSEASSSIKKLLELGYPDSKLFYYRAGISSWKALGLTIYQGLV